VEHAAAQPGQTGLRRSLGLVQLTASGVGLIVGAGIYVLLAAMADASGGGVWLAFGAAGALSALSALSYSELAAMYPRASAEHEYVRRVAPPWAAFVTGWMMLAGLVVAAGAVALGFAAYVQVFVDVPPRAAAWALLVAVCLIALSGIERSAGLAVVLSGIQVLALVGVVVVGIPHVGDHSLVAGASFGGVIAGAALAFFAFVGFDEVITMSEEVRDPTRTVPRALLLALGISTLLYMAVAVIAVSVLGAEQLGASEQPLADVVSVATGGSGRRLVAVVALMATTNTTLLVVTAASRILYGMAATSAVPRTFRSLNRRQVPARAVLVCAGVAAAFAALGRIALVASVTDMAVYLVFLAVNATVIALRFRQPNRLRPFRTPLAVGRVPVLPVAALATTVIMLTGLEPAALLLGLGIVVLGLLAYALLPHPDGQTFDDGFQGHDMRRSTVTTDEAKAAARALLVDPAAARWTIEDLRDGMEVELEHGRADPDTNVTDDDLLRTAKIALAHLNEIPDYYPRLHAMEEEARAYWRSNPS
jgi:APA family basic amino acid/polyamine antiporter